MFSKRDASLMTCETSCHTAPHGCRDSIVMNCPMGVDHAFATILFLQFCGLLFRGDKHHLLTRILVGNLIKNFRIEINWYQILIDQKKRSDLSPYVVPLIRQ